MSATSQPSGPRNVVINNNQTMNPSNPTAVDGYSKTTLIRTIFLGAATTLGGVCWAQKILQGNPETRGSKLLLQGAELCKKHIDKIAIGTAAAILSPEYFQFGCAIYNNPRTTGITIGSISLVGIGILIGPTIEKLARSAGLIQ